MGAVSTLPVLTSRNPAGSLAAWVFPGQGSQRPGMGADLLDRFPDLIATADAILGYSVRDLCLHGPDERLRQTQYAQPAIYLVNALHHRALDAEPPALLAGHSLGEYNALLAAGCFDFETGLRLVQRRGELMGRAVGGGMIAVIGLEASQVVELLATSGLTALDIANYNSRNQIVLAGPQALIPVAVQAVKRAGGRCIALDVSAAFHSRYMAEAAEAFAADVCTIAFNDPGCPVIANVTAQPYLRETIADLLVRQITSPVRWYESMQYALEHGVSELREVGASTVLTGLWRSVRAEPPAPAPAPPRPASAPRAPALGSASFCRDYGIRYAYLAGSMFRGVASPSLVVRMAKAGLMGFLGTGGLTPEEIDRALDEISRQLEPGAPYGANLLYQFDEPEAEPATVAQFLRHDVRFVEAAAYTQVTPSLVHFRFAGACRNTHGRPRTVRHILAKVSRPQVASAFMLPAAEGLLSSLVADGSLTAAEAAIARQLPVSQDICVESDSAGHTDGGIALALIPVMCRLRDQAMARHHYPDRIRVGASGGLGSPEAVAAAFVLGADFIVTGSVNQCSPQAGTSAAVKDLLATLDVQDTTYAPAGDMFEMGAKVQVVRKGTLFAARANKLYQLYRQYESLDAIDGQTRDTIEATYFRRSFEQVWRDTMAYHLGRGQAHEIERAEQNPRHRMALLFRWYFAHSIQLALDGDSAERVNFQIHCGPAMGAFNRFVRGTDLEDWRDRHVDVIAERLMSGATECLGRRAVDLC